MKLNVLNGSGFVLNGKIGNQWSKFAAWADPKVFVDYIKQEAASLETASKKNRGIQAYLANRPQPLLLHIQEFRPDMFQK